LNPGYTEYEAGMLFLTPLFHVNTDISFFLFPFFLSLFFLSFSFHSLFFKAKVVPLHAMNEPGGEEV
jgi:hypothetical protein